MKNITLLEFLRKIALGTDDDVGELIEDYRRGFVSISGIKASKFK